MIFKNQLILWFISLVRVTIAVYGSNEDESGVREFLENLNEKSAEIASKLVSAQWEFETSHTDNAKQKLFQVTSDAIENAKLRFQKVVRGYPWWSFSSPDIRRQLKLYSEIGMLALSAGGYQQFQKIISDVDIVHLNTTICDYYNKTKCDLHLNPDIQEKLKTSQNSGELSYLWSEWKRATEPELKRLLENYVGFCNHAAKLNNYTNFKEYSLRNIELKDVREKMSLLWEDIKPLYQQIHSYVRGRLRDIYGEKIVPLRGPIPAHLLGNIWSENWSGIADRIVPFLEQDKLNFTSVMVTQGYTPDLIHRVAEEFIGSMNFSIPSQLWDNDTNGTPQGVNRDGCHPKIFNFYNQKVRIKDCGKVSLKDYLQAHSLVTKAEYMLQYSHQPFVYQSPADPGLEEAVNNIITMSASTFDNLKKLELYKRDITNEVRINRLFKMAMEKIISLPFLLVQELFRWDIFSGKPIEEAVNVLNDLREKFQGISTFKKELSFDPGGIGSVFSRLSLAHHFFGHYIEFQLYESLCHMIEEKQDNNAIFDECNLFRKTEAGVALRNMMSLGSSKPLMETLSPILGQTGINSKSILKYFKPLMDWLRKENERTGEFIGWEKPELPTKKIRRRKRSLDYQAEEGKDDDTDSTSSREPDRFQRLIHKRSKDKKEKLDTSERERKSAVDNNENNNKKLTKNKNSVVDNRKQRSPEEAKRRSIFSINRRSPINDNEKMTPAKEQKANENPHNKKRHSYSQNYDNSKSLRRARNNGERWSTHKKRSHDNAGNKSNANGKGNGKDEGDGDDQVRYARKARKKERRFDKEPSTVQTHKIWRRKEKNQREKERSSRDAQWHTDNKKDISRLLHSFGFAMENDDKDKIKELKKKLKGDSNSDLKSNIASKESNYEGMADYNRAKSGERRSDAGADKGTNKLWPVKSYVADNAKVLQSNPTLDKKEAAVSPHLTSSMLTRSSEEKSIGKKDTSLSGDSSGRETVSDNSESHLSQNLESSIRHLNLNFDMPSLQAFLQKADLSAYGQKPLYTISPDMTDNKARGEMKPNSNKFMNGPFFYKYTPTGEINQFKDKKELKDDSENGGKSPYIIILGQLSPDMKERLMQEKGVTFFEGDRQQLLQSGAASEERKMSDKRTRSSDQIYIVPIDLKTAQNSPLNSNHYSEHGHEVGHDPNAVHDHESEDELLHLKDNSKLDDKSSLYKAGKENPSDFIISWNNEKNKKVVKRSKREHKSDMGDEKMKVVRLAPMKESILEGLLGKSFDRANLDDKNVKILFHDGMLNGGRDYSSALNPSVNPSSGSMSSSLAEQSQTAGMQQPAASLSSLATSVLSALSPKGFAQVKANQRQDAELEEDAIKDTPSGQAISKDQKEQEMPFLMNPGLRCNALIGKKKGAKLYSDDDTKKLVDVDSAAKGDDSCCKKIILTPCPPKCPGPCPCPFPCPLPCPLPCPCPSPCPCPDDCCKRVIECPPLCRGECPDPCCKKPSECSLVNCQFKITKAKKPHERLTIMIYDRINPPAELPEPYDALAVISEILQRIQCCSCKPCCQLTEEDPDYPANDNSDQLKSNLNQQQDNKGKAQELSGEMPILGNDSPEEDETDDNTPSTQNSPSADEDKYQPKEKATPAIDQLTVFNRDKLKPVFIDLRKIDDIINKRSQLE